MILDAYRLFAQLRLRWYARASGRVLLRHWQWLVIAGMAVPSTPVIGLFRLLTQLFIAIVSPGHSLAWYLACISTVQLAALMWILPQRRHLSGGPFMHYAAALPVPTLVRRGVDLTLLALADTLPFLIPGAIAMAIVENAYQAAALPVLLASAVSAQMALMQRRLIILFGVALADTALAWGLSLPPGILAWSLLPMALASAFAALFIPATTRRNRRPLSRPARPLPSGASWLPPSLLIQYKALAAHPALNAVRLATAIALAIGAARLIAIFQFDERSLPAAILAMAAIALLLSGIYRALRDAHAPMRAYLSALPMPRHYWLLRDIVFVMLLGTAPLALLLLPLELHRLSPVLTLIALAFAYQTLLALMRLPLALGGRHSVILGFLLAALWSGAAMAAVAR